MCVPSWQLFTRVGRLEALNLLLVSALKVRTCEELTRPRETVEELR